MLSVFLAALGWLVLGLVPGALLVASACPEIGPLRNVTLAVPASFGTVMLVGESLQGLGLPVRPWIVVPVAFAIPAAIWLAVRRRSRRSFIFGGWGGQRADLLALLLAILIGLTVWSIAIRSPSAVLPNTDGAHHALFATRIRDLGTLGPGTVLSGDLATGYGRETYYPLAIHLAAAQIAAVTGAPVNTVLTVGMVLAASVLLPIGTLVLSRRLSSSDPDVGRVAAVISVVLPWFPYAQVTWGGLPFIVAMCQVPGAIAAALYRPREGRVLSVGTVLGIAAYGLFQEHDSELVTVGVYVLVVGLVRVRRWPRVERRALLATWGVGTAVFILPVTFLVPELALFGKDASSVLADGSSAVTGGKPSPLIPAANLASILSPIVFCLALAGGVMAVQARQLRGWGWCAGVTTLLFAATLWHLPVVTRLTTPWYESPIRLASLFSFFETTYGAVAIVAIARVVSPHVLRITRIGLRPLVGLCTVGIVASQAGLVIGVPRLAYAHDSLVGGDQRAAFTWLAAHVRPGGRVLNQFADGSSWMEVLDGVTPVFAVKPRVSDDDPRVYLLTHALDIEHNLRARGDLAALHVRYVYVNEAHFDGMPPNILTAANLSAAGGYRLVWARGDASIFEVAVAG